jgi:hypothetical protein
LVSLQCSYNKNDLSIILNLRIMGMKILLAIKRRNHKGLSCFQSNIILVTLQIIWRQVIRQ